MEGEDKLYLFISALAFLALNVGLFMFSFQHLTIGEKLDPIFLSGVVAHGAMSLGTIVFIIYRLKE
jgi:hypothetical protein